MAGGMKSLAKDTALYGLSSIVGRFLNWCLVPLYVRTMPETDMGIHSNLYGYVAFLLVFLTYGMETGFFRFINKEDEKSRTVYSTTLFSIGSTSLLFIISCLVFLTPISNALGYQSHPEYILIMAITVGIDAFLTIPFAMLRQKKMAARFAALKLIVIFITILLNIFFLVICPAIYKSAPSLIDWFYKPNLGVGYVFISNLLATIINFVLMLPYLTGFKYKIDLGLLKRMLQYSFPLLILSIAGILNQTVDKMLYPLLFEDKTEALRQLGIYGACFKMALIMNMFTQAFRFAYEPFVFAKKDTDDTSTYAEAMKYFIIFSLIIFLGVMFYMDVLKYFLTPKYFEGLIVVPIVMIGYIFFGIYFNLSFWYKLADKTYYGAVFSSIGCIITIIIVVVFVPIYGYIASAWASLICNAIMMLLSYFVGQKYCPIEYNLKKIFFYFGLAAVLYIAGILLPIENTALRLFIRTILLVIFLLIVIKKDLPLKELPVLNKFFRK